MDMLKKTVKVRVREVSQLDELIQHGHAATIMTNRLTHQFIG